MEYEQSSQPIDIGLLSKHPGGAAKARCGAVLWAGCMLAKAFEVW
jgi:hypothetical protein